MEIKIWGIISLLLVLAIAGCAKDGNVVKDNISDDFNATLAELGRIDAEHGTGILDYTQGVSYIRWHPRENPLNIGEIDLILEEYDKLKGSTEDGASILIISARRNLLDSERHYKLAYKTAKGQLTDGFRCSEKDYIIDSIENLELSAEAGHKAIADLSKIFEKYPETAKLINVSKFWVKLVNVTYDDVANEAGVKEATFNSRCSLGETNQTISDNALPTVKASDAKTSDNAPETAVSSKTASNRTVIIR